MNYQVVNNFDECKEDVAFFEQNIEIRIENSQWYGLTIQRDNEGNIIDIIKDPYLINFINQDIEGDTLSVLIDDGYIWYDLDQWVWDTDIGETSIVGFKLKDIISNSFFDKEGIEFLKNKEDKNSYIGIKFKINENIIYFEDENY